jgi:MOSC domain-containing protein YiiM
MSESEQALLVETPPELWRGVRFGGQMWSGAVESIFIAAKPSGAMMSVPQVRAFADRGLEGDRFFRESWNAANRPDKAVTLIEAEVLELAAKELGIDHIADRTRRNIVTRGVPLVELLHREFTVGNVRMHGLRLFEPCGHMEKLAQVPGIFKALENRSGLKAAIVGDGAIHVGDPVRLVDAQAAAASL